jgi:hypothetical protein
MHGRTRLHVFVGFIVALLGPSAEVGAESRQIGHSDFWHYDGEVEVKSDSVSACRNTAACEQYCNESHCAHGFGFLGNDASWTYHGTFVHGRMDGAGRLEADFFEYVGGFEDGKFHGVGVLTCFVGRTDVVRYKGEFHRGTMPGTGQPVGPGGPKTISWNGPCG